MPSADINRFPFLDASAMNRFLDVFEKREREIERERERGKGVRATFPMSQKEVNQEL